MTTELFIQLLAVAMGAGGVGTILLRLIEGFLKRGERQVDEASDIRKELRAQNVDLVKRINDSEDRAQIQEEKYIARLNSIEKELDEWKTRFYDLQRNYFELIGEKEALAQKTVVMQCEIDTLRKEVDVLRIASKRIDKSLKT